VATNHTGTDNAAVVRWDQVLLRAGLAVLCTSTGALSLAGTGLSDQRTIRAFQAACRLDPRAVPVRPVGQPLLEWVCVAATGLGLLLAALGLARAIGERRVSALVLVAGVMVVQLAVLGFGLIVLRDWLVLPNGTVTLLTGDHCPGSPADMSIQQ
jgi:hypothetical protein